jgi:hypothetical protein
LEEHGGLFLLALLKPSEAILDVGEIVADNLLATLGDAKNPPEQGNCACPVPVPQVIANRRIFVILKSPYQRERKDQKSALK